MKAEASRPHSKKLEDEHAVAVGEEAVAFGDGLVVGFHDEVAAGHGGNEHHEGGLGKMKVGEEGVDRFELAWGVDENVGGVGGGLGIGRVGLRRDALTRG